MLKETTHFGRSGDLSAAALRLIQDRALPERHPRGALLVGAATPARGGGDLIFVRTGTLRVQRRRGPTDAQTLFHLRGGRGLDLSAACLLALEPDDLEAVAQTALTTLRLPRASFEALMLRSQSFRACLFQAYSKRLVALGDAVADRGALLPRAAPHHDRRISP